MTFQISNYSEPAQHLRIFFVCSAQFDLRTNSNAWKLVLRTKKTLQFQSKFVVPKMELLCCVLSSHFFFTLFFCDFFLSSIHAQFYERLIFCSFVHCPLLVINAWFFAAVDVGGRLHQKLPEKCFYSLSMRICMWSAIFFHRMQPDSVVSGFIEVFYGPVACPLPQRERAILAQKIDLVIIEGFCPFAWIQIKVIMYCYITPIETAFFQNTNVLHWSMN